MKVSCLIALLAVTQTSAFTTPSPSSTLLQQRSIVLSATPAASTNNDVFFRAVECAEGSRATMDELDKLATDLEDVDGCKFEEGESECEKEIRDRIDVAQILRLRIELQLRTDYLKKENLFASDVHKSHDAEERKRFREMLEANREKASDGSEGSDLGLW